MGHRAGSNCPETGILFFDVYLQTKPIDMLPLKLNISALLLAMSTLLSAQQVICVDSTHYNFAQPCLALSDPVCGCDHSLPSNSCYAFYYNALSCWTGTCPEVDKGCEVKFQYEIEGDELQLSNQSIVGMGDSIIAFSWQNDYQPFAQTGNTVFDMPAGETAFKISLQIRTLNGCDAFCTYLIQRSIDATAGPSPADGLQVFPNPASDRLFLRLEKPMSALYLYSLNGSEQLRQPLKGARAAEVDVAALPRSLYILALYDGEQMYYRKVVVK